MNPILIDLGFVEIYWYSLYIFLGLLLGGFLIIKESERFGVSEEFVTNLFFWTIPVSVIGARIWYVIFNLSYYKNNLLDVFKI